MSEARDRVVRKALELFAERGYDAVSMRDLGKALGMQAPSIYSHFPSKESLLRATLAPLLDGLDDALALAPIASNDPNAEETRAWLRRWVGVMLAERMASRIATYDQAATWNDELRARLLPMHDRLLAVLAQLGVTNLTLATAVIGGISAPLHVDELPDNYTLDVAVAGAERLIAAAARHS